MTGLSKIKRRLRGRFMPRYALYFNDPLEPDKPEVEDAAEGDDNSEELFREALQHAQEGPYMPRLGDPDEEGDEERTRRRPFIA